MRPNKGSKKRKTTKDKNPAGSSLDHRVLDRYIRQQEAWILLLQESEHIDLTRTKVPISFARWMHIRLGDALRFVAAHQARHLSQADSVLAMAKIALGTDEEAPQS